MKISLEKGGTISLSKANEGLEKVLFGAGWDLNEGTGGNFDLDISAVLREGGKVTNPQNLVFYNNLKSACGSVVLSGDSRTGNRRHRRGENHPPKSFTVRAANRTADYNKRHLCTQPRQRSGRAVGRICVGKRPCRLGPAR